MSRLSGTAQFLVGICLVAISLTVCVIAGFATGGMVLSALVALVLLGLLIVAVSIWKWRRQGNVTVYRILIAAFSGVALAALGIPKVAELILAAVWPIIRTWVPALPDRFPEYNPTQAWPVLVFGLGFAFLVLRSLRESQVTATTTKPLSVDFPEPTFRDRLVAFAGLLKDDLEARDRETNWSHAYFAPIEAEVEVHGRQRRQLTQLLPALRKSHRSRAFLVIGDPGSGKSVALRQLTRELLAEAPRTGTIPLYINLREWRPPAQWAESLPPVNSVIADLHAFVRGNIAERLDVFGKQFVDLFFDRLLAAGRLFLVMDSFDEIGLLLDAQDRSPIIQLFSDALWRFIHGQNCGRGILASRPFRRPTFEFKAETRLEIRPLSDRHIQELIRRRVLVGPEEIIRELFTRPDLVAAARNVFTGALLLDYIGQHQNKDDRFPVTRAQLYDFYTRQRISDAARYTKTEVSEAVLVQACIRLGNSMLETASLEMSLDEIELRLPGEDWIALTALLKSARLLRVGSGMSPNISFVHRRFAEYFAALSLKHSGSLPLTSIPSDSRWRDTLVIFCEIAEMSSAESIAKRCWEEMKPLVDAPANSTTERRLRAIHCLRFLIDAFPQRRDACESFLQPLTMFVAKTLDESQDLLLTKLAVEAAGVLRPRQLSVLLIGALSRGDSWISDTAFRACQYVEAAEPRLERAVASYMETLTHLAMLLLRGKQHIFSLSLCPILHRVKRYSTFLYWESVAIVFSVAAICIHSAWMFFYPSQTQAARINSLLDVVFIGIIFLGVEIVSLSSPLRISGFTVSRSVGRDVFTSGIVGGFLVGAIIYLVTLFLGKSKSGPPMFIFIGMTVILISTPAFIYKSVFLKGTERARDILVRLYHSYSNVLFGALTLAALTFLPAGFTKAVGFVLVVLFLLFFLAIFLASVGMFVNLTRDAWRLRYVRKRTAFTRPWLLETFLTFRTQWGRASFVAFLDKIGVRPTGDWPDGKAPNKNDTASTHLAQLEERWLELDY